MGKKLNFYFFTVAATFLLAMPSAQILRAQETSPDPAPHDSMSHAEVKSTNWIEANWRREGKTKLERVSYVLGASLAFSLFDYVAFNYVVFLPSNTDHSVPFTYRVVQSTVQVALSYFLYKTCGLSSTVSFNLIWWTWGDDFAWYGWTNLINAGAPWYNRVNNGLMGNGVTWAGWTPIGLFRHKGSIVSKDALAAQSIIGFSVAIALN